jgi:hypothetical protein
MPDRFPLAFGALSEGLPCIWHQPLFLSPGTRTASRPSSIRPLTTHCRVQKTGPNSSCDAFSVLATSPAPLPGRRHRAMPMPWPALPLRVRVRLRGAARQNHRRDRPAPTVPLLSALFGKALVERTKIDHNSLVRSAADLLIAVACRHFEVNSFSLDVDYLGRRPQAVLQYKLRRHSKLAAFLDLGRLGHEL